MSQRKRKKNDNHLVKTKVRASVQKYLFVLQNFQCRKMTEQRLLGLQHVLTVFACTLVYELLNLAPVSVSKRLP